MCGGFRQLRIFVVSHDKKNTPVLKGQHRGAQRLLEPLEALAQCSKHAGVKRRKAWLNGSGPNPRVGLAVRWVESGGNQPPLPATRCGGHNQLACMSGARCQAGLVEYNGGCYGCGTLGQACCKDWSNIPTPGGWQGVCAQGYCGYPGGSCRQ
jgi:hypothetical protein